MSAKAYVPVHQVLRQEIDPECNRLFIYYEGIDGKECCYTAKLNGIQELDTEAD